MFVFGGNTTKASFNDLWEFRVGCGTWRQVRAAGGQAPSGRVGHTLCAMGSRLLVLGGREYSTNRFDPGLHSFNFTSKRWSQVALRPEESQHAHDDDEGRGSTQAADGGANALVRTGHCATLFAGSVLLFGGLNDREEMLDDLISVELIS